MHLLSIIAGCFLLLVKVQHIISEVDNEPATIKVVANVVVDVKIDLKIPRQNSDLEERDQGDRYSSYQYSRDKDSSESDKDSSDKDSRSFCYRGECKDMGVKIPSCTPDDRPRFKDKVVKKFKIQCTHTQQMLPCSGTTVHLAHVYSWQKMCKLTTLYITNTKWVELKSLIELLFEVDDDAVVWLGTSNPRTSKKHSDYMDTDLNKINKEYEVKCLDLLEKIKNGGTDAQIKDLLSHMNSAPANLRYGMGYINSSIQERLDPMGDDQQKTTTKEKKWLGTPYFSGKRDIDIGTTTCTKCSCDDAMKSSSSTADNTNFYVCE